MYTVDLYLRVRLACHVDGISEREAASRFGIARETVKKMLRHAEPPGYRRRVPPKRPKLDGFTDMIDLILEDDRTVHRKQLSLPFIPSCLPTTARLSGTDIILSQWIL